MPLTQIPKFTKIARSILLTVSALAVSGLIPSAHAQYTDRHAIDDLGGPSAFAERRAALAKELNTGFTLLFARNEIPEASHYREDNDFYYFTGLQDPGAVLMIDNSDGTITLFEPQQSGRTAQVYGANLLSLPQTEREKLGFSKVIPVSDLDVSLSSATRRSETPEIWIRLGFPDKADGARSEVGRDHAWKFAHPYREPIPQDLAPAKLLAERYPMMRFRDLTPAIDAMRNIKTPKEIEVLRKNGKISAEGNRQAMAHARPGMFQYEIEARALNYYLSHGAQGVAYLAIVGSGENANTWHYFSDREVIQPNDLVVFDFAASLDHLTMDITRTFNINGKFPPDQAKWYAVDLASQKAVIALLRPGHTYEEADAAGKAVYDKAGIGDQWLGFPGHFVGLATHDVMATKGPVKSGQVVTVEPIIEFPAKREHYRVEDTVLITDGEPEILSSGVPKELTEVEKLIGSQAQDK
jgi:Xaa-Pro aminopeptidase